MFEPPTCDETEWQLIYRVKNEELPDWNEDTTRVIRRPAEDFKNSREAMAYFKKAHGRIFQNLSTRRYWAARVARVPSPR
jgi:hypothetical protein